MDRWSEDDALFDRADKDWDRFLVVTNDEDVTDVVVAEIERVFVSGVSFEMDASLVDEIATAPRNVRSSFSIVTEPDDTVDGCDGAIWWPTSDMVESSLVMFIVLILVVVVL